MFAPLILVGLLAVVLAIGAVWLALANSRLKVELDEARRTWPRQLEAASRDANDARHTASAVREELAATQARLTQALAAEKQKEDWLDHQEKEVAWYKEELTKRPKIIRRTYKILTLGVSGTGKTALTLKWANPLVDLGTLRGTKVERYERTVSHVQDGDELVEHVFEIRDWGGEHIVDAQQELIVDEIHGLLFVVDLAAPGGDGVDPERIQQQLHEFRAASLKFFFGPKTLAMCQSVVLFVNKSDVLSGTLAEIERAARSHFQPLIDDLTRYKSQLDVTIFVGSATYGHSTHHLFAHFVSHILPESAYDQQLLQRMKTDVGTDGGGEPSRGGHGSRSDGTRPVLTGAPAAPTPRSAGVPPAPPALPVPASPPPPPRRTVPLAVPPARRPAAPGAPVTSPQPAPPDASSALSTHTETMPHVGRR